MIQDIFIRAKQSCPNIFNRHITICLQQNIAIIDRFYKNCIDPNTRGVYTRLFDVQPHNKYDYNMLNVLLLFIEEELPRPVQLTETDKGIQLTSNNNKLVLNLPK